MQLGTNQDSPVMLSVNCRATGSYDCDYVAKGNPEEELIRDIDQHARQVHDLGPGGLSPQIEEKLKSQIYTV
jgi:predicted small metal-binding protein